MSKQNKIQAIRGMNDVLPNQTPVWQYLEQIMQSLLNSYSYQEIRFPVLEQTQLFKRSIGEVTDIVEKEMYTFEDRNGDSLSLRPEGTACCVRAAEQHGLLYNQSQKLWYMGPMYRHERPQKGRYRQFYQLGVEAFGMAGVDIEAELIMLSADLWQRLGLAEHLQLEMNNLGKSADRARFGQELKTYLLQHKASLDEDSQRRLDSNVLRILDSKSPQTQAILQDAPKLSDFIDQESKSNFEKLLNYLQTAGVQVHLNPSLVRGLDYYNGMVFEWTTDKLGAQATVCAGGRFDGLAKQLGGSDTPAVGFAMGMERLLLLLEELALIPDHVYEKVDVYIVVIGEGVQSQALLLAQQIRTALPGLQVLTHCGGGKYNSQLKKAFNSGARCALVLEGDNELGEIKAKILSDDGATELLQPERVCEWLTTVFNNS
ncbi:histidine--tRNA ligase [Gammaproteobacteria bacterium]|nr:histidine--tRNA ligase [Gammaproteobacteria bacterium]